MVDADLAGGFIINDFQPGEFDRASVLVLRSSLALGEIVYLYGLPRSWHGRRLWLLNITTAKILMLSDSITPAGADPQVADGTQFFVNDYGSLTLAPKGGAVLLMYCCPFDYGSERPAELHSGRWLVLESNTYLRVYDAQQNNTGLFAPAGNDSGSGVPNFQRQLVPHLAGPAKLAVWLNHG